MLNPKTWSLSVKFSITITVVVAGVGFIIGAVMVVQDWKKFHEALGDNALLLAESVAVTAPRTMLRKDYWSLYLSLKNMAARTPGENQSNSVVSGMILDTEGRVQAHLQPSEHPIGLQYSAPSEKEKYLFENAMSVRKPTIQKGEVFSRDGFQEGVVPLFADKKYLGVVRVRLSTGQLREKALNSTVTVIVMTLALIVLGSLLGVYASRRMVGPLTAVTRGLETVGQGDMGEFHPIPVGGNDEIGRLSATFNKIMEELAQKKDLEQEIAMSEKLVALGRISAGVAHEVNNPLAGLLNCIDTLQKHPDDHALVERYLPLIEQGLNRIRDIVNSLLVELRVEDSDEPVSAAHINNVKELLEAEFTDSNIEIVWENHVNDGIYIQGRRIEQIVYNLIKNAVQALPAGGMVKFTAYHDDPFVIMEVSDNGSGIPTSHRNQLFDPFFTTKSNGAGLGLWVVYRLVQSMSGVIEVESEEGHGTVFHVSIPVIET